MALVHRPPAKILTMFDYAYKILNLVLHSCFIPQANLAAVAWLNSFLLYLRTYHQEKMLSIA